MTKTNTEFKILALDVEVRNQLTDTPPFIEECGAILHEYHSRKDLATLDTLEYGNVLPFMPFMDPHGKIHRPTEGITQEELFHKLLLLIADADILVGHKGKWDVGQIKELLFKRYAQPDQLARIERLPIVCTMLGLADAIGHIDTIGNPSKWPELKEALDHYIPDNDFDPRHKGFEDAKATLQLFLAAFEAGDLPLQCAI
jgi:hypothetical protein